MAKFDNPLNNLKVASPCSQDWEGMMGDNRKRYCGECKLNVYNLSGMSKTEAENLIMNAEGRLCVRFYKRADGSVITQNCPVGWAKVKQRTRVFATAAFSLIISLFSGLLFVSAFTRSNAISKKLPTPFSTPVPEPLMGAIAAPTPNPKATPKATPKPREIMGEIEMSEGNEEIVGKLVQKDYRK